MSFYYEHPSISEEPSMTTNSDRVTRAKNLIDLLLERIEDEVVVGDASVLMDLAETVNHLAESVSYLDQL